MVIILSRTYHKDRAYSNQKFVFDPEYFRKSQ